MPWRGSSGLDCLGDREFDWAQYRGGALDTERSASVHSHVGDVARSAGAGWVDAVREEWMTQDHIACLAGRWHRVLNVNRSIDGCADLGAWDATRLVSGNEAGDGTVRSGTQELRSTQA